MIDKCNVVNFLYLGGVDWWIVLVGWWQSHWFPFNKSMDWWQIFIHVKRIEWVIDWLFLWIGFQLWWIRSVWMRIWLGFKGCLNCYNKAIGSASIVKRAKRIAKKARNLFARKRKRMLWRDWRMKIILRQYAGGKFDDVFIVFKIKAMFFRRNKRQEMRKWSPRNSSPRKNKYASILI